MSQQQGVALTDKLVQSFRCGKVFNREIPANLQKNNNNSIGNTNVTSLDYHKEGKFLVTSSEDCTLHIYDGYEGKHISTLKSLATNCRLARYTHHQTAVLYAGISQKHGNVS